MPPFEGSKIRIKTETRTDENKTKLNRFSRAILAEEFQKLDENSQYDVMFKKFHGKQTPTRYKYYFGCVLVFALPLAMPYYGFIDGGEIRKIQNTDELHYHMKMKFNRIEAIDVATGETFFCPQSTVGQSDRKFIGEFLEQVLEHFHGEPFFLEGLPTYDEWKEHHRLKEWDKVLAMNNL